MSGFKIQEVAQIIRKIFYMSFVINIVPIIVVG